MTYLTISIGKVSRISFWARYWDWVKDPSFCPTGAYRNSLGSCGQIFTSGFGDKIWRHAFGIAVNRWVSRNLLEPGVLA